MLINSKTDHQQLILNTANLEVLSRVLVGPDPHEVEVSDDGTTAYVSNTGYDVFHELDIIDLTHQQVVDNFDTAPVMGLNGLVYCAGELWMTT